MPRTRPRFSSAHVVAAIALVFALTGTAVAAGTLIGSRQIRDNSIRSADLRDGEVGATDIGYAAVRSVDVADGALRTHDIRDGSLTLADLGTGQRTRVLQPGETITGVIGGRFTAAAAASVGSAAASLPLRAPAPLNDADVILDGSAADTNICLGTASSPTSGTGRVCVYVLTAVNAQGIAVRGAGSSGFLVDWESAAAGTSSYAATWAYKAS